jgi:hypothetical protein
MPPDESKSPLILEFEEFQRKLEAAARLTRSARDRIAKGIYDIAFFPYASRARNAEAEKSHVLLVPDAEDPQSWQSITGSTQRERLDAALWYYIEAFLARMRAPIREYFKPVADSARRSSSTDLLSSNLLFQEALHSVPHYITAYRIESQDPLCALCEFWGRPDWIASVNERLHRLFAEEWERFVCEAELEAPPLPPTQTTPAVHGDTRSRALAGASENAAEEEESPADRRRREIISAAVKLKLKGSKYAAYLHNNGLLPSRRLQGKGCSDYIAGYKKFKKSFWKEKTRFVNESTKKKSSKKRTMIN